MLSVLNADKMRQSVFQDADYSGGRKRREEREGRGEVAQLD